MPQTRSTKPSTGTLDAGKKLPRARRSTPTKDAVDESHAFAALRFVAETSRGQSRKPEELLLRFPPGEWDALEEAAMEWTYVLRSRQRWVASTKASEEHTERATETLYSFNVSPEMLQRIARASHVEVRIEASDSHDGGWSLRIFPWEYVIAAATRPFRHGDLITITRTMQVERKAALRASQRAKRPSNGSLRVLYVESAPGEIGKQREFRGERELIDIYLMGRPDSPNLKRLYSPSLEELAEVVTEHRPHIVHLCGVDSHEARILLRGMSQDDPTRKAVPAKASPITEDPENATQRDGYLLCGARGEARVVEPEDLAQALTGRKQWFPWLVCMNLENSAARMAPRAVQWGVNAAIGFQDSFDAALAKRFFGTLYSDLRKGKDLVPAFREAWRWVRGQPGSLLGSGIVLWTSTPTRDLQGASARVAPPDARETTAPHANPDEVNLAWIRSRVGINVVPKREINYSQLHNDGELFDEFSIKPHPDFSAYGVNVRVTLCAGLEDAKFSCAVDLKGRPVDLRGEIKVSLSANLIRSVHEAIGTTWRVEVAWGRHVLLRNTYPVRLLPTDQWRDAMQGRSWLPSFVFPRDRATVALVARAADYVRVLRDDPTAGFEGYQGLPDRPTPRDAAAVDLQVQAIWSTILYEWRLTYINPPPTYSAELDSQRLRTPSMISRDRHGTCIDLALLLAGCLELVDIWPVIFLLNDHAFPGYWRADSFHDRFSSARPEAGALSEIMTANAASNSAAGAQRYPWAVGRAMTREILREVRSGRLVPLETVRLTESCGFAEAVEAGKENFEDPERFEFLIDIAIARQNNITPLPLLGDAP